MRIVFDNMDFTESLDIGFRGKHQIDLITIVKEHRDKYGNFLCAEMLWASSYPWRKLCFWIRRQLSFHQ